MLDAQGRETVTVAKAALLAELRKNRTEHRNVFEKAIVGWKARVIEELERSITDAKHGNKFNGYFSIPRPNDQTGDYDRVIKMVEMSVGETVTLSNADFACYVMDDWRWKKEFTASAAMYMK